MPNNNIELITNYSPKYWDLVYKQEAVTSVLDANPKLLQFTGAKTVKIGKFQNGGLNDYYRNNNANGLGDTRVPQPTGGENFVGASDFGYQKSGMRLVWEEYTLRCDRAAAFEVEYFDNEESGEELVGLGVTEISRTTIVPEVDAYCLSTIASYAELGGKVDNESYSDKPLAALNKAFQYFEEHEVPADDQIVFCSPAFINALRNTGEVQKFLTQDDFTANKDIRFKIEMYEGRRLITVAPDRLRTNIKLGQGGYYWDKESQPIDFLMVAKSAVMHVVKYEKVRVISGEANLAARGFDGYTIFARIYHDVFVPENKRVALYLKVSGTAAAKPVVDIDIRTKKTDGVTKITAINTLPGNALCFVGTSSDSAPSVGSTLTNFTLAKVSDVVSTTTTFYAIDSNKKVLAKTTVTVA
jgi:hypothetical protein